LNLVATQRGQQQPNGSMGEKKIGEKKKNHQEAEKAE
jgi:hypothetical protein